MKNLQKPGEKPNGPGEYKEVTKQGNDLKKQRKVHIDRNDSHLPPTRKSGRRWKKT